MRNFFPILFLLLAVLSIFTWLNQAEKASPNKEAVAFLHDLQSGNLTKIVEHFGGNTCNCPARNGWGAFLSYQPGQETNLAFLLGHRFIIGTPVAKRIATPPQAKYAAPFEAPEDYAVDIPLNFSAQQYSPIFLPLPMAYGKNMTWQEAQEFIKDPAVEASKGFSLRLRPGLAPGTIKLDTSTLAANVLGEFKFLQPNSTKKVSPGKKGEYSEKIKAILANSIKESDNEYITPQDAGAVIMPDGNYMSIKKLSEILPRLRSVNICLHVVRRGKMRPWTVFHFLLKNPVLEESGGKLIQLN